jgi:pyruvate/2-oxoglutarate dehydrogenase complex dihydrolipoamide dehydrogenase (E3) component
MTIEPGAGVPDAHDAELLSHVRPPDWRNPTPTAPYNLVVIGAGPAGLVTAAIAAGLGAKVALVERERMGGDCLNTGCVPSKALIRAGRTAAEARRAAELGLAVSGAIDFGAAMERVRRVRARIAREDSARRYRDELGVDVFLGAARFVSGEEIAVEGARLRFRRAVIATGSRPVVPPIEGLPGAGFLTNESVFELRERPARLGVIGGGPIGCELAQAFQRLGSRVVLLEAGAQLLPREDADAVGVVEARMAHEGVRVLTGCAVERVEASGPARRLRVRRAGGASEEIEVDALLVAVGRAPGVEGLDLERAGVAWDAQRGVHVDDHLRTANPRIFAAGDCCMAWKFTHAADAAARIAVQNALFFPMRRVSGLVMPWCTYTDPELAHVGLHEREARQRGIEITTFDVPLAEVNRAVTDGEEEGFARIHVRRGRDEIVGATIVAGHAGELISEITLAMGGRVGLGRILDVIHPYPTQAEAVRRAAGAYTRTRATPLVRALLARWMSLRR